jgi:protein-S-isoprenylcysteine O-methyltransferase Ste14
MSHATNPVRLLVAERAHLARMPALIIVVYAAAVYLLFLAVLSYAVGFFAGFGVPKGIDQGPRAAGYILVGIAFEERDLIQSLGDTYGAYRARVPALIPRSSLRRHSPGS